MCVWMCCNSGASAGRISLGGSFQGQLSWQNTIVGRWQLQRVKVNEEGNSFSIKQSVDMQVKPKQDGTVEDFMKVR